MKRTLGLLAVLVVLVAAGCSSSDSDGATTSSTTDAPSTTADATTTTAAVPEPVDDQTPPASINGIDVQGDTIWVASIKADEILQVRRSDGAIVARHATNGAGPDDVAVAPDGSVWSTGFANGDIGRIADGEYVVLEASGIAGINPIAVDQDGAVFIGTYGPDGSLFRVTRTPDGSQSARMALAEGTLPDINAFGILDDGTIVAPAGGIGGPGSAIAIDPTDGTFSTIVDGLPAVAAGATDADGNVYLLANVTGEVIRIDVEAGTSEVVRTVTEGAPFDNMAFAADGTLYLSSFVAPTITEVAPDGATRVISIGG